MFKLGWLERGILQFISTEYYFASPSPSLLRFLMISIVGFIFCIKSGERMMDYMNLDDRSIGMFWVVSYTMAQPACETVMNWLTSAGVTEHLPGPNLQSNERLMVMREVCPLPISLLSGLSINLCLKVAFQLEESMFSGQVLINSYDISSLCKKTSVSATLRILKVWRSILSHSFLWFYCLGSC